MGNRWTKQDFFRYGMAGIIVFLVSSVLSFFFFREHEPKISIKLAKVIFKDELILSHETQGELKPLKGWDVIAKSAGRLDQVLAKNGDLVQKDQVVAAINETENKHSLEAALANFNKQAAQFAHAEGLYRDGSLAQPEYAKAQQKYLDSRIELQSLKKRLEDSLIRSPAEGYFTLGNTNIGDSITEGGHVASVEDLSKYMIPIRVSPAQEKRHPPAG